MIRETLESNDGIDVCLFCGRTNTAKVSQTNVARHVVCRKCGLVFQSPQPSRDELAEHYIRNYWEWRNDRVAGNTRRAVSIAEWLSPHVDERSIVLEIGCGNGENLVELRKFGCKLLGVEPSPCAAQRARAQGLEVECCNLEEVSYVDVDVVILCHVLEHLHHPIESCRQLRRMLKPGGLLLVEVPNIFGWTSTKGPRAWFSYEHLWYFSPSKLKMILSASGFRVARIATVGGPVRALATPLIDEPVTMIGSESYANECLQVRLSILRYRTVHFLTRAAGYVKRAAITYSEKQSRIQV